MLIQETESVVFYSEQEQVWKNTNGKYHRVDGPAFIYSDGSKVWFFHSELHRVDGPAIIRSDGSQKWYLNGEYHREDGPAVIFPDGVKYWYLDGNKVTREEAER